jgi:hypothetical protein
MIPLPCLLLGVSRVGTNHQQKLLGYLLRPAPLNEHHTRSVENRVGLPFALILGYSLHGLWDLLHELQAHGAYSAFEPGQLTPIPLAYGVFLCSFRLLHGGVFLYATRRVGCRVEGGAAQPVRARILGSCGRRVQA